MCKNEINNNYNYVFTLCILCTYLFMSTIINVLTVYVILTNNLWETVARMRIVACHAYICVNNSTKSTQ